MKYDLAVIKMFSDRIAPKSLDYARVKPEYIIKKFTESKSANYCQVLFPNVEKVRIDYERPIQVYLYYLFRLTFCTPKPEGQYFTESIPIEAIESTFNLTPNEFINNLRAMNTKVIEHKNEA